MDKGYGQRADQRAHGGDPEGFQMAIAHQMADDDELLVHELEAVVDQQEAGGQRVDHVADEQTVEAVDVKELMAEQLGDQSLFAEGIDDGKAVGDGGQQHRHLGEQGDGFLESRRQVRAVCRVGEQERQQYGDGCG